MIRSDVSKYKRKKKKRKRKRGVRENPWKPREIIAVRRVATQNETVSRLAANLTTDPIGDEHVSLEKNEGKTRGGWGHTGNQRRIRNVEGMGEEGKKKKRQRMEAVTPCTFGETNLINGPGRAQSQGGYVYARRERAGTQKRRALYGEASVVLITILTSGRTNVHVYTKGVDRVYVRIKYT